MTVSHAPSTPAERVFEALGRVGILPVVEIDDPALAVRLGEVLLSEGLPCAEITFRTAGAAAAITALRRDCPELLLGAGTILSTQQVDVAREAGAAFLVSPGFDPAVVQHARSSGLPIVPGVCTPSEIQVASGQDLHVLKFFPAEVAGGVRFLKAVLPVFPHIQYVPTGGIGPANVAAYLELPAVLACGGSWMVPRKLIASSDFGSIRRLIREAVELSRTTRGQALPGRA
jgi:2-dehydro-3-deoxyphosphogluconate aldolase/(4S)-4-hydroxy-2-oxoglutarate aldolase